MSGTPKLVVVIVADQLRADHLGFGGLAMGHTPHLDSIAATGARFDRAHATNPVCMPSRATLATGMWPSAHGTRTNGIPLHPAAETVMRSLRRGGWTTAAVGKLHYQPMGWPFIPFQQAEIDATDPALTDASLRDARHDAESFVADAEMIGRHRSGPVAMPEDYYGFGGVELVAGHGDLCAGHYEHWLRAKGVDPTELGGWDRSPRPSQLWGEVWESGLPVEYHTSTYVAERASVQIEKAAGRDTPTFLFVSFPDPHHPFCPPAPYSTKYDPAEMPVPPSFDHAHHDLPPHLSRMFERRGHPHLDATFLWAPTLEQYREAMAAQMGLISLLDDSVGHVLGTIEASGLADDTLTMFTADHGDLLGDHGLMLKHYAHYEAVTRVPLVMSGPGIEVQRSDALVSNADVVPTLLDLSGAEPWRGIQGRSLRGVLEGHTAEPRASVLVEEDQPVGLEGLPAPVRMRTVLTDAGRLTHYHGQPFGELYDHDLDPDETVNLYDEAEGAELKQQLHQALLDQVLDLADQGRRIPWSA